MTTYEEISTTRKLNRAFWNQDCRYVISHIREAQRIHDAKREANCRRWLKTVMTHRVEHTYLKAGL